MKLKSKERAGSKVTKPYDRAQTPYQRVAAVQVSEAEKQGLRAKYQTLNPAALKKKLMRLQDQLLKSTASLKSARQRLRQLQQRSLFF